MADLLERVLASMGPCLSSQLVAELIEKHGLKPATARQRLSRNERIKRLAYLKFPRNVRFVYLQSEYGSPIFWSRLIGALFEHTRAYGCAIAALRARRGIVPIRHFEIACGSPQAQRGHMSARTVVERLIEAQLFQRIDVPGIGECIQLSQKIDPDAPEVHRLRARLQIEKILLLAIKSWARNLGLVSYAKVKVRDDPEGGEPPKVGTFLWDLSGPSYVAALVGWSKDKPKPGFVVCDVMLDVQVTGPDIGPFIHKCQTLRSLKGVGRCVQILMADEYNSEAFGLAKANGILPATPTSLFGDEVAQALLELSSLLRAAYPQAGDAERFDKVFNQLSKIEGVATNLRGDLFEFVCAEVVRQFDGTTDIQMNVVAKVPDMGSAEIDLLVRPGVRALRFIECRGYQPAGEIPLDMVQKWLEKKVPVMRQWAEAQVHLRDREMSFEFWTAGQLSAEAKAYLDGANRSKYSVKLVDAKELERMSTRCEAALRRTLAQHFFHHPLAKLERDLDREHSRTHLREARLVKREPLDEELYPPVQPVHPLQLTRLDSLPKQLDRD